ncbi:hypothetical protein K504DRAFT_453894 [Pleomassaria siparia CBS 279.74]|uniref:Uncharacterized protein n=1 Tax=Pleomassaria siparia CBS 279.74 TaxID=1314801 RepID=A0A6G1KER6_9PLEO|nr:hypothetical protein K504DRAFT_453894 [Pleomassaria siparia CBS 279.74]
MLLVGLTCCMTRIKSKKGNSCYKRVSCRVYYRSNYYKSTYLSPSTISLPTISLPTISLPTSIYSKPTHISLRISNYYKSNYLSLRTPTHISLRICTLTASLSLCKVKLIASNSRCLRAYSNTKFTVTYALI